MQDNPKFKNMKVEKNKVVALSYKLEVDGAIADKACANHPLMYIHGTGMLLPKFEAEVEGKDEGDTFAFTLTPAEGYGEYNPAYRIPIPKSSFEVDGKLREDMLVVGATIPMLNNTGQVVQGTICNIEADTVTMDFNHPMAGKTLNFSGKVESVREASEKELKEGLNGEYLPKEEGGCCGKGKKEGKGDCGCGGKEKNGGCCGNGGGCCGD